MPEFHAEVPQATASEGLAQGPYVAARVGFKPANLRTKGNKSTNEPPRPTTVDWFHVFSGSMHLGEPVTGDLSACSA